MNKTTNLKKTLIHKQYEASKTHDGDQRPASYSASLPTTQDRFESWKLDDDAFLKDAETFTNAFTDQAATFFGYPGNLNSDSPTVRRLRELETRLFYVNNAGDPYEQGDSTFDGKFFERKLLKLFYAKFGMDEEKSWGYVTSGGSESNVWGINNGFRRFPDGRLYFCEAAHYSVLKAVTNGQHVLYPFTVIDQTSPKDERIDIEKLIEIVRYNYESRHETPILLLTWGTTKMGSCDEVVGITQRLKSINIPFYVHLDAAYFGGIPNNQIEAPVCPSVSTMNVNSVSVSFHKYFGVPNINSVVVSIDKADGSFVSYLGHRDTTVLGSRTFPIFSALWRIKEILERSPQDEYCRNIRYFETKLLENRLVYFRAPLSSIFVFPCPSKSVLTHYHLASFEGTSGKVSLAHCIINPFHTQAELDALICDLTKDQKDHPQVLDL